MGPESRLTRRTVGMRPQGRSERVVDAVLHATVEELNRVGYAAMRVEDVAARCGVNKTTIYRRWPTKSDLAATAIRIAKPVIPIPDTGCLEADLRAYLQEASAFARSPFGSGLIRVIHAERMHPELEPTVTALRIEHRELRLQRLRRAISQGELPAGTDAEVLVDVLFAPIFSRMCIDANTADEAFIDSLLGIVLAGARNCHPGPSTPTH